MALVAGAVLLTGAPGFAADATPAQGSTAQPAHRDLVFNADTPATKSSARSGIRKWTQKSLYYYRAIPTKWHWSLTKAVSKWNSSGSRIKLVRTAYRSKAKVTISYGNTGAAAGKATIGATSGAYVHLSSKWASYDATDPWRRIAVMAIFTHELGHVLGYGHTTTRCSLMKAVLDISACHLPATSPAGYYKCRTIDAPLVRSFVKWYGGRAKLPTATWCLIDPLPSALTGVSFSGGVDSPVTVNWARPTTVPTGSKVEIRTWPGEQCTDTPAWADTVLVAPSALQWQDEQASTNETSCFRARLVNRYGAGRATVDGLMSRWMRPVSEPVTEQVTESDPRVTETRSPRPVAGCRDGVPKAERCGRLFGVHHHVIIID